MEGMEEIRCPRCDGKTNWDKQDDALIGEHRFTERMLVCVQNCGWYGPVAWFPWPDNPPAPGIPVEEIMARATEIHVGPHRPRLVEDDE